jgi:hypothetical protein
LPEICFLFQKLPIIFIFSPEEVVKWNESQMNSSLRFGKLIAKGMHFCFCHIINTVLSFWLSTHLLFFFTSVYFLTMRKESKSTALYPKGRAWTMERRIKENHGRNYPMLSLHLLKFLNFFTKWSSR